MPPKTAKNRKNAAPVRKSTRAIKKKPPTSDSENESNDTGPSHFYSARFQYGLKLKRADLLELWQYDNECARKYMPSCPLRMCKKIQDMKEELAQLGKKPDEAVMRQWKPRIKNMWKNASGYCEVYIKRDSAANLRRGYRMRLKDNGCKFQKQYKTAFGWIASVPSSMMISTQDEKGVIHYELDSWAHVFNRSRVTANTTAGKLNYLGGPASFMNCSEPDKVTASLLPGENHTVAKFELTGVYSGGSELMWDYGVKTSSKPVEAVANKKIKLEKDAGKIKETSEESPYEEIDKWFIPDCCSETHVQHAVMKRRYEKANKDQHQKYQIEKGLYYQEMCILCKHIFSRANAESRIFPKQHYVGKHADFLGTTWNGLGDYDEFHEPDNVPEVDLDLVLYNAERLMQLLAALKSKGWTAVPAHTCFTQKELDGKTDIPIPCLMKEYKNRRDNLKQYGLVFLRGMECPSEVGHFQPIKTSKWACLRWKDDNKPGTGQFAVSDGIKEEISKTTLTDMAKCLGVELVA